MRVCRMGMYGWKVRPVCVVHWESCKCRAPVRQTVRRHTRAHKEGQPRAAVKYESDSYFITCGSLDTAAAGAAQRVGHGDSACAPPALPPTATRSGYGKVGKRPSQVSCLTTHGQVAWEVVSSLSYCAAALICPSLTARRSRAWYEDSHTRRGTRTRLHMNATTTGRGVIRQT